jgi:hypothetical protein
MTPDTVDPNEPFAAIVADMICRVVGGSVEDLEGLPETRAPHHRRGRSDRRFPGVSRKG